MKISELKRLLKENDCCLYREGKSHEIWLSKRTGKRFTVPCHATQDVPVGTLKSIKQSAGIE